MIKRGVGEKKAGPPESQKGQIRGGPIRGQDHHILTAELYKAKRRTEGEEGKKEEQTKKKTSAIGGVIFDRMLMGPGLDRSGERSLGGLQGGVKEGVQLYPLNISSKDSWGGEVEARKGEERVSVKVWGGRTVAKARPGSEPSREMKILTEL